MSDFSGEIVPQTYQNVSLARHLFGNCELVEMAGEIYGIDPLSQLTFFNNNRHPNNEL